MYFFDELRCFLKLVYFAKMINGAKVIEIHMMFLCNIETFFK